MKISKKKVATFGPAAQRIMNSKNEFELAFDQIKNIIFKVVHLKDWAENVGVLNYKRLVLSTIKNKDSDDKMRYIKGHCEPFLRLYNAYRDSVLEEDFGFLTDTKAEVNLTVGKSGQAILPLSAVYRFLQKSDEIAVEDLEAKLLFIFKHLTGPESDDRKKMEKICANYEVKEDQSVAKTIDGIVRGVKDDLAGMNVQGREANVGDLMPFAQKIMANQDLQQGMTALATSLMTGQLDIPTLINQVKNSGSMQTLVDAGGDGKNGGEKSSGKGKEEEDDVEEDGKDE